MQGNYGNFPMRASQLWYAGSDGKWLAVAATVEKHWQRLCGAIERNDLIEDERCVDRPTRQRNLEWIVVRSPFPALAWPVLRLLTAVALITQAELEPEFAKATRDEWLDRLIEADVPCSPIHDYESLVEEQQLWENDYLVHVPHPRFGEEHTVVPTPIELSDTPTTIQVRRWAQLRGCLRCADRACMRRSGQGVAPELGADTAKVLEELGMSAAQIADFEAAGAFGRARL